MSVTPTDLSDLSIEELSALKHRWYQDAVADGSIAAIGRVVRELGTEQRKKHGANWIWRDGDVQIVLDDWTGHSHASFGDRLVYALDHITSLFVPGAWIETVRAADVVARRRIEERRAAHAEDRRLALLRQLGGA